MKTLQFIFIVFFLSCNSATESTDKDAHPVYVSPTIDKYGHLRKGYVRMPVSTNKNAIKNRNRSRYYYKTRGKYSHKHR